jgi:bacteriocin biosynthesis cyclodehydratase domain-containing protein
VPSYVLQETVEAFPATDGSIYFLRGGGDAEQVLPQPTADERVLLELLHAPRTEEELRKAAPESDAAALLGDLRALGLVTDRPGRPSTLPSEARRRFDRQLPYFEATGPVEAEEAQRRLMAATVVIVGCGGLGSWTAANLACTGLGHLVLVDDDTVALSNLNRQLLFRHADLGRRKVDAAADALRAFDPELRITRAHRRVRCVEDVLDLAEGADLIVATADHPPYAIVRWIDEASVRLGVPHVSAAQFPPQVRVGPLFVPGVTGCLHCQETAARREFPEYDALVRYREAHHRPAATVGPLSGLVGSLLATDAMHLITGVATPATQGRALVIDSRTLAVDVETATREPGCERCGDP